MTQPADLFAQQEANRKASRRLIAGFILFLTWLGFGGDLIWYLWSSAESAARMQQGYSPGGVHVFPGVGLTLLAISALMAWWGFRFGAVSLIKGAAGREITEPETDEERRLVNVVEEMSIAAGSPRPRIWLIPDSAPNAFATGVRPNESHVAVTAGLLDTCTRDELQAVVAHELGHVVNYDVRLMTLLTTLVGAVALVHYSAFRPMRYGRGFGGSRGRGGDSRGPPVLVLVLLVIWVLSWIIAPLVTRLVAMRVGRSREFLADAMSAQFTRNPAALADALSKIGQAGVKPSVIPRSSAHLCIVDPFRSLWDERRGRMADLMATHPPLEERLSRLRAMAYQYQGGIAQRPPAPSFRPNSKLKT